jgi:hypothetical protein
MLDKAHAEGVAILGLAHHPSKPGILGAQVSSSRPGELPYAVWLYGADSGCDCPGYEKHGYCKHWALVLDRAGLLPDLEEAPGETPAAAEHTAAPWELPTPTILVAAAMQHPDRKAAAAADLARRQSLHPTRVVDLAVA